MLAYRLRLVGAREQLRANTLQVRHQVRRQFLDGHAVDTGTSLVRFDTLECFPQIVTPDHLFQVVGSRASVSVRHHRRFTASFGPRAFISFAKRELPLQGLLVPVLR
jgi:hypothetical protein